jgi:hypothetical protein
VFQYIKRCQKKNYLEVLRHIGMIIEKQHADMAEKVIIPDFYERTRGEASCPSPLFDKDQIVMAKEEARRLTPSVRTGRM